MRKQDKEQRNPVSRQAEEKVLVYEPPRVRTYTSEEILEEIGPAQACSPSPCPAGN